MVGSGSALVWSTLVAWSGRLPPRRISGARASECRAQVARSARGGAPPRRESTESPDDDDDSTVFPLVRIALKGADAVPQLASAARPQRRICAMKSGSMPRHDGRTGGRSPAWAGCAGQLFIRLVVHRCSPATDASGPVRGRLGSSGRRLAARGGTSAFLDLSMAHPVHDALQVRALAKVHDAWACRRCIRTWNPMPLAATAGSHTRVRNVSRGIGVPAVVVKRRCSRSRLRLCACRSRWRSRP